MNRKLLRRLIQTEYIPYAGLLAGWALMAAACGVADAVRLAAAVLMVGAARSLTQPSTGALLAARLERGRRFVLTIAVAALAAGVIVLAMLAGLTMMSDRLAAAMLLILGIGFPARYLLVLTGRPRRRLATFRNSLAWSGVGLLGLAALMDWGWMGAAAALAGREWLALTALAIRGLVDARAAPGESDERGARAPSGAAAWAQVAQASHGRARRRLVHRGVRDLTHGLLGPFGGLVSRTTRGSRLNARLARFIPHSRVGLLALSVAPAAAGIALMLVSRDPWHTLSAAVLLRFAAYCGAAAAWGSLAEIPHNVV